MRVERQRAMSRASLASSCARAAWRCAIAISSTELVGRVARRHVDGVSALADCWTTQPRRRVMGGKSNKKNKRNNSNKPADVTIDAEDGALDELPESAEGPRAHVNVSADELAAATDKPAKTWLDQQVERMRRA